MRRAFFYILIICLTLFSGCFSKKNKEIPGNIKLPKLGITFKLPESFQQLPKEQIDNMEMLGATILDLYPFTVIPYYAYAETSGKAILVVSELKFKEGAIIAKYPLDNIYIYKEKLEDYFASGEISYEEMGDDKVSTVLLAMILDEDGKDIALFKGLCHTYPYNYFMLDLYVVKDKADSADAQDYIKIFSSLGIYQ